MSSNKVIISGAVPHSTPVVQQPTLMSSAAEQSAKKMARKDKEFLWELDSQVKGILIFIFNQARDFDNKIQ